MMEDITVLSIHKIKERTYYVGVRSYQAKYIVFSSDGNRFFRRTNRELAAFTSLDAASHYINTMKVNALLENS